MRAHTSRRRFLASGLALPALSAAQSSRAPELEHRTLGNTGLKVTSLGFGCLLASDSVVVERACDLGINFYDTARHYQGGNNERMLAAGLRGRRDNIVIASKSVAKTKSEMLGHLETSLKTLGTDYLDIWYMHDQKDPAGINDDMLEAHEAARKAGKIRFSGVSFHTKMVEMIQKCLDLGVIDVALTSYNFTLGPELTESINAAREKGLGIVAMKTMAGGYNRIKQGVIPYGRPADELTATLRQDNAMLSALKFALNNPNVDSAIVGITDFAELEEDMRAMSEPYSEADEKLLAVQRESIRPRYCQACGACDGQCGKGVQVAETQRQLMYAEGYGQFALARESYLSQPAEARAARCSGCSTCTVTCPNGLDVRRNLIRAQEMFG